MTLDLLEQLLKSPGPDRELDNAIWATLDQPLPDDPVEWPPRYTASVDAAMTLIPDGHRWRCGYSKHVPHVAEVIDYQTHRGAFIGECDSTRAIALCIAALKSRKS